MSDSSEVRLLRETPGFRELEPAVLETLLAKATRRRIGAGMRLFGAGEPFLGEVYIVSSGEIELHRADGRSDTATPGYLVGLSSYLGNSPYASSAVARLDTELLVITAADLRLAESREPGVRVRWDSAIRAGYRMNPRTFGGVSAGTLCPPSIGPGVPVTSVEIPVARLFA